MKKQLLLCVGLALCLSACGQGGQGTGADKTVPQSTESSEPDESRQTEETVQKPEQTDGAETETVEADTQADNGWQLASGYGICRPGESTVYVLDSSNGYPQIKEEDAEAELIAAVCQDGLMSVRVKIRDYSLTLVPQEVVRDGDGYFTIDEEQGLYGHSAFEERRSKESGTGDGTAARSEAIYGKGLCETGASFRKTSSNWEEEYLDQGYATTVAEMTTVPNVMEEAAPEGTYELRLDGFSEPIRFTFKEAVQYASLEEIPGGTVRDGYFLMAEAEPDVDSLAVRLYTYPPEGYRLNPGNIKVTYRMKDGGETTGALTERAYAFEVEDLSGFSPKSMKEQSYTMPDMETVESIYCEFPESYITSEEQSGTVTIPIPEEHEDLDQKVELKDCTVYLTGVECLEDRYDFGSVDGENVTKPMVTVSARVENRKSDRSLYWVTGKDPKEKENSDPYGTVTAWGDFARDHGQKNGELIGFTVLYEDGSDQINLQLINPIYSWNQALSVVVQLVK